jgi:heme exporter protein C
MYYFPTFGAIKMNSKKYWWKALAAVLVCYVIIGGLLIDVPALPILNETIRNLYFHVTMWFAMMFLMSVSLVKSIQLLHSNKMEHDTAASEAVKVSVLLGCLGVITGSLWARYTWGAFWVNDPKLNGSAITLLVYLAYMVLRNSIENEEKRARIAAVYNVFAYVIMLVFIMILPRLTDSLHPGNGGNPAFSTYDLNSNMRYVFYPAVLAWILIGLWLWDIKLRIRKLNNKIDEIENS